MTNEQRVALINLANSSPFKPPEKPLTGKERLISFKDLPHVTQAEVAHNSDKMILTVVIKYLNELLALSQRIMAEMEGQPWVDGKNIDFINKEQ